VPIVAGTIGMYGLDRIPCDNPFWLLISYCAGTGGSMLIIGSAAGVVAMGIAKIDFLWYCRVVTPLAALGYAAGAAVFILMH
jgi:Na+/H+ antiporter NhaD/arsenite permease-like protein